MTPIWKASFIQSGPKVTQLYSDNKEILSKNWKWDIRTQGKRLCYSSVFLRFKNQTNISKHIIVQKKPLPFPCFVNTACICYKAASIVAN